VHGQVSDLATRSTGSGLPTWSFADRVVVVTDADSPRGAHQVQAFAAAGATVYACGDEDGRTQDGSVRRLAVDLTDEASIEGLARRLAAEQSLDAVVLNEPEAPDQPGLEVEIDEWQRLLGGGLTADLLVAKHLAPLMFPGDYGKFVLTTGPESIRGVDGRPHVCAARQAVVGLCKCLAIEFAAHHINVNVAAPAAAAGGRGEPDAIQALTHTVLWLASDAARYVTASVVRADAPSPAAA
jgi:NAD(P)-dependent dehydrogenase (short-subunit alcohol dehydrogenase family)